jgi:hypothetical protein
MAPGVAISKECSALDDESATEGTGELRHGEQADIRCALREHQGAGWIAWRVVHLDWWGDREAGWRGSAIHPHSTWRVSVAGKLAADEGAAGGRCGYPAFGEQLAVAGQHCVAVDAEVAGKLTASRKEVAWPEPAAANVGDDCAGDPEK